ncbi:MULTISPECIES: hypothetical protein [Methylobacteriaceae]|uniref:hypothetical protein n=1 Tax=Methylobacteriaceae TaxID=119045 RepID=UPI002F35EB7E
MRNGSMRANPSQALNVLVSAVITVAIAITVIVGHDLHAAIGIWAGLSGLLQLTTGVRRWRSARGQWPQILSGSQTSPTAARTPRSRASCATLTPRSRTSRTVSI